MKIAIIFVTLLVLLAGCVQNTPPAAPNKTISGISELVPNDADLQQIGVARSGDCQLDKYETSESSPVAEYGNCNYTIREEADVYFEVTKFTNTNDLNGSYQYSSLHYFGAKGFMNDTSFGDQSRFHVNNDDDYGAEFNPPGVYYYHLWFTKDLYLVHVTSKGLESDKSIVAGIGNAILAKFG